jgi:hypothetical protein
MCADSVDYSVMECVRRSFVPSAVGFILGVLVASLTHKTIAENRAQSQASKYRVSWEQHADRTYEAYMLGVHGQIPIPYGIDWSTNTWRQLAFWRAFAQAYSIGMVTQRNERRPLRTYGLNIKDPDWMEWRDAAEGARLAEQALMRLREGMDSADLREWVSSAYKYPLLPERIRPDPSLGEPVSLSDSQNE